MPRWLPRTLARVRRLAADGRVRFTLKALQELGALGLDVEDAVEVLRGLTARDSAGRLAATETGEWMYVFRPEIAGDRPYLKLVIRWDCVLISFHEGEKGDNPSER